MGLQLVGRLGAAAAALPSSARLFEPAARNSTNPLRAAIGGTVGTFIRGCATARPDYEYSQAEIRAELRSWLERRAPDRLPLLERFLDSVQVERRAAVVPLDEVFSSASFEQKNARYIERASELAVDALLGGIEAAGRAPSEIDQIVCVSCTGFSIPSIDARILERVGLRRDVQRLPVSQMGCSGGTAALTYASDYTRAHPGSVSAVLAVETPSLTLRPNDVSTANLVSSALFADGAACAVLDSDVARSAKGLEVVGHRMLQLPNSTHVMGYDLTNEGLQIVLEREVPAVIEANLIDVITPFLAEHGVEVSELETLIFHPGSVRILESAAALFKPYGLDVDLSRAVLREHGNMSSATVLHILARQLGAMSAETSEGSPRYGLMLSFGPGFTANTILVRW